MVKKTKQQQQLVNHNTQVDKASQTRKKLVKITNDSVNVEPDEINSDHIRGTETNQKIIRRQ